MNNFNCQDFFLVAGASSGIGRAVTLALSAAGASVIAVARNQNKLEETKKLCPAPERVFIEAKDLSQDIDSLPAYISDLKAQYGKLRGLVSSIGIGCVNPIRSSNLAQSRLVLDVNYLAPLFLVKGFADRRNNAGKGSSAVVLASREGVYPDVGMTLYAGAKGALIASMKAVAREIAPTGVRINCVSPGLVETVMADDLARQYADGKYPLGLGKPNDVANLVVFLLSDEARWITGQNYILDGGCCTV